MPLAKFGIDEHGFGVPARVARRLALIRSNCRPTLNGLQSFSSVLNGPAAVLLIPSGKNGRCKNPPARSVKATEPSSRSPSAFARSTYDPRPAARNSAAALGLE